MSLTAYERETAINFTDEDDNAMVYTCNRAMTNHMDKLVEKFPDMFKLKRLIYDDEEVCGKEYICPKNLISIRSPRQISDEQRQALSERMKKISNNREI
jgi:hypothetical protein